MLGNKQCISAPCKTNLLKGDVLGTAEQGLYHMPSHHPATCFPHSSRGHRPALMC